MMGQSDKILLISGSLNVFYKNNISQLKLLSWSKNVGSGLCIDLRLYFHDFCEQLIFINLYIFFFSENKHLS